MDHVGANLVVLVVGVALTFYIGRLLARVGQPYLEGAFPDTRLAGSIDKLLYILFLLVVLGLLVLLAATDLGIESSLQIVMIKLGVVLLVMGTAHGLTMLGLSRIKSRRRAEEMSAQIAVEIERVRQERAANGNAADTAGTDGTASDQAAAPRAYE